MSDAASSHHAERHGLSFLPQDLTEHQLIDAPALASVDELLIDELTDDEDDAFATALADDA